MNNNVYLMLSDCTKLYTKLPHETPNGIVKGVGRDCNCPLNFSLSKSFLLAEKFWSKNTKFGGDNECPILGERKSKIEILSTQNLLCGKFAAVCLKIAYFPNRQHHWTNLSSVCVCVCKHGRHKTRRTD